MNFFFFGRNFYFFLCFSRVFVLQISVSREKNMTEVVSSEWVRDDPIPQVPAGWCHLPKDDIYEIGGEGEVNEKTWIRKISSVKTLSKKRKYFLELV